jgi:N utilization substance protein B
MASNRHLGRIIALQTLYEYELRLEVNDTGVSLEAVLARNCGRYRRLVDEPEFIARLARGVITEQAHLDSELQPVAPEWPIDKIARMDRLVLRMGLYELTHTRDVPAKVVINEAVELGKAFGNDNSSKFINGVLGTLLRQKTDASGQEASAPAPKPRADEQPAKAKQEPSS